jgi:hypothetical protein
MKYAEFEQRVVDTFNRMHYAESCDDGFIEGGYEYDVSNILSKAMKDMFHIKFTSTDGYTVSATTLTRLFIDDEDDFLLEALDSFNGIMDRYNVVPHDVKKQNIKGLQVI